MAPMIIVTSIAPIIIVGHRCGRFAPGSPWAPCPDEVLSAMVVVVTLVLGKCVLDVLGSVVVEAHGCLNRLNLVLQM
jgi:hypothetical protein